jgi:hypothetical protein
VVTCTPPKPPLLLRGDAQGKCLAENQIALNQESAWTLPLTNALTIMFLSV